MRKFKFETIKNGSISIGYVKLDIINHIAKVETMTKPIEVLIDSYGGIEVKAKAKAKRVIPKIENKESD